MIEEYTELRKYSCHRSNTSSSSSPSQMYQKISVIGMGTFGKVYLAIHKNNNEKYAIKQVEQDSKYKNRELNILSKMDHPNIIKMTTHFHTAANNKIFSHIVMEYMDTSLFSILKKQRELKRPIDLLRRKLITFQLFKGLYYLSINNICHRDLKPTNVLLNRQNYELKICDFGSAKVIQKKQNNVSYICSRYYRAPELILNSTKYGFEVDMWSAGCIMVELLTLEPVFPGDSSVQQLIQIIKVLGSPPKHLMAAYSNSSDLLQNIKSREWHQLLKRYNPTSDELDIIKKILTYDTDKRLTPLQALKHPFFADLCYQQSVGQLPLLFNFQSLKVKKNRKAVNELSTLFDSYRVASQKCAMSRLAQTSATNKQI